MKTKVASLFSVTICCAVYLVGASNLEAQGTVLFSDEFESGLTQWTGFNGSSTSGFILSDPLGSGSQVLSFSGTSYVGDIFTSSSINVSGATSVKVRFDYLGKAVAGSIPDNFGGFIGLATTLTVGSGAWIAGTDQSAANGAGFVGIHILDDGNWHSYEVDVTSVIQNNSWNSIYVKLEDWGDGGPTGDVFFDNVSIVAVPEPKSAALMGLGILTFISYFLRKSRNLRLPGYCWSFPPRITSKSCVAVDRRLGISPC